MYKRVRIAKHQIGLRFRAGDLAEVLVPGRYWVRSPAWGGMRDEVEIHDPEVGRLESERLPVLVRDERVAALVTVVDLADGERAIVWKDGRVSWVLGPGLHAFWKGPAKLRIERVDATSLRLETKNVDAVLAADAARRLLREVTVAEDHEVLVFRDGVLEARVTSGRYVYWTNVARVVAKSVDLREQVLDVAGQEIMTRDKVTLRVNLVVTYRVSNATAAVTRVADVSQTLYREAQLVLRAAVGTREIDDLLADKESVGSEVAEALSGRAADFGVAVGAVGLRDIVLPGDMKTILNRVITARKEAEANVIKRREETAAARSQANTAKLLAENPVLARIRELELMGDILAGTNATFVLGKGDLAEQITSLVGTRKE